MAKYGFKEYAYDVLKTLGKPLTAKEIWEEGQKLNLNFHTNGKTPVDTLGAQLYVDMRDNKNTKFCIYSKKPTKFFILDPNHPIIKPIQEEIDEPDIEMKEEIPTEKNQCGYVYILTNPSFPEYVKIGSSLNVEDRVRRMNGTECTPFSFRIYATYKVPGHLKDIPIHDLIDELDPSLRSIEILNGRRRVREFYAMTPERALRLIRFIAKTNGLENNIKLYKISATEQKEQNAAENVKELSIDRHHFKNIEFNSSLTGKRYKGGTSEEGTLLIIEADTGIEIENNANPSKKAIIGRAIIDYGGQTDRNESLYQRYRKLTKLVTKK